MEKKVKKAVSRGMLKRYIASLLTVVTFITAIPLGNLSLVKANDAVANGGEEYDYYINVSIDLNGGYSDGIYYMSQVDRDGNGYSEGQWVNGLAIGKTFRDKNYANHTVQKRGADEPGTGEFVIRADAVGITPHVVITTPSRDGYTFVGWDTNASINYFDESSDAFDLGCWNPGSIYITAMWERNEADMTVYWDSGVSYVATNGYDSAYDFNFNGQTHTFALGETIQTNIHIKDGYEIRGIQEGSTLWTDYWTNTSYPGVAFDYWNMDVNRSVKVLTKTTLSFEYDEGFTNTSHTETANTDSVYKDYPKFNENYELDYAEDLDTGDKWYSYDGRDSRGSYISFTASRPRHIKYHSKLKESAKLTLNLDQNGATTKGTERVDVYHNLKISDVTIPKREYTATFWDIDGTPKKICSDIVNKFKFLGYKNEERKFENQTKSDPDNFQNYIISMEASDTSAIRYETIDTYAGSGYYFDTYLYGSGTNTITLNTPSEYSGWLKIQLGHNKHNTGTTVSYKVRAHELKNANGKQLTVNKYQEIYDGYINDDSTEEYIWVDCMTSIDILVEGIGNRDNVEICVYGVTLAAEKNTYWYDENGKGLINYPLTSNHTIKAVWSNAYIIFPEAPAKEGYEFVGWRTEDAKLMTADYKKSDDDEDYNDCMNKFNGDVAAWYRASRNAENNVSDIMVGRYLVPGSYYINDEVLHFQYYGIDYAGDEVTLNKDTRFIACYDEIPKVTVKFISGSDKTNEYNQKYDMTVYKGQSLKIPEESADWYKGRKYVISFENNGVGTKPASYTGNAPFDYWDVRSGIDEDADGFYAGQTIYRVTMDGTLIARFNDLEITDLPVLSADGYEFEGWYEDEELTVKADSVQIDGYGYNVLDDPQIITLYAKWKQTTAHLTTIGETGISATSHKDSTEIAVGSSVNVSASLERGYVFKGWFNGDVKVSDDLSFVFVMPDVNRTLRQREGTRKSNWEAKAC